MGRKASSETTTGPIDYVQVLSAEIEKEYGKSSIVNAEQFLADKKQIIPWSPSLDIILSGGVPEGSWVSVNGRPKVGKTTSLLSFAAKAQLPENGARTVYFLSVEGRFKEMNLRGIKGLNLSNDRFKLIQSTKEKILSTQDFLTIAEKIIKTHPKSVIIIDSISALADEKELTGGIGTETRGHNQKVISQFCNNTANIVPVMDCIVMGVTHTIANTSGFGSPTAEKAAVRWLYQSDIRIKANYAAPWMVPKTNGREVGKIIKWSCLTSALGPPGMQIDSYMRYNVGIDDIYELIEFANSTGLIEQSGSWYILNFCCEPGQEPLKKQGGENVYHYLLENPDKVNLLRTKLSGLSEGLASAGGE